jgi:hypothetical protein
MPTTYQKPLPNESIRKHLLMLVNYLRDSRVEDQVAARRQAKELLADKLEELSNGRYV